MTLDAKLDSHTMFFKSKEEQSGGTVDWPFMLQRRNRGEIYGATSAMVGQKSL